MDQNPLAKFLGLTKTELRLFLSLGGLLVLVIMLFEGYILYNSDRAAPGPVSTSTLELTAAVVFYQPAPSLTGWPTPTSATKQPTIAPTRTPRPTYTPSLTRTPRPTPTPTVTVTPTRPSPTATIQVGTSGNPVAMGTAFTFADLGSLTVTKSSWSPGQTGLVNVHLYFVCERPSGERCDTSKLLLDALGSSGLGYEQVFDPAVPEPSFGSYMRAHLYGGETEGGYVGFLIKNIETSLKMRVQIFLEVGEFFFWIGPNPSG